MTDTNEDDIDLFYERPCDGTQEPERPRSPGSSFSGEPVSDEPVVAAAEMARWPQMTTLFRDFPDSVMKILVACDECEVVTEVAASDSGNVKGNKWVRLHDVVFGGRDDGTRGLIPEFPMIPLPSKFKRKVVSIWQFGLDETKVPTEIHRYCIRQHKAHTDTCKALAQSNKAAKEKYAELAGKMKEYEDSVGALPIGARVPPPPGARPDDGGGRMNHSTNLQARQPAGFGFVQQQARVANLPVMPSTPSASPAPPAAAPLSSGQVNTQALSNLNRLGSTFDSVVARLMPTTPATNASASTPSEITYSSSNKRKHEDKIKIAKRKKNELAEQIEFIRPMKDDTADSKVHFMDITRQYIQASREVIQLMNDTKVDDED